jgi:hypothetical protein
MDRCTSMGLISMLVLIVASQAVAETVLTPRTKAEHEAELKALQEKYGPRSDPKLQAQTGQVVTAQTTAPSAPVRSNTAVAGNLSAADIERDARQAADAVKSSQKLAPGQKIRVDLMARSDGRFGFNGKDYQRIELQAVLQALGKNYKIDHLVLMQSAADQPIALTQKLALSDLSTTLKTPALFQDGTQLRAVDAQK